MFFENKSDKPLVIIIDMRRIQIKYLLGDNRFRGQPGLTGVYSHLDHGFVINV